MISLLHTEPGFLFLKPRNYVFLFRSLSKKYVWPWQILSVHWIACTVSYQTCIVIEYRSQCMIVGRYTESDSVATLSIPMTHFKMHTISLWAISLPLHKPRTCFNFTHFTEYKTCAKWCEYEFNGILNDNCNKKFSLFAEHWLFNESNTCERRMFTTLNKVDHKCEN